MELELVVLLVERAVESVDTRTDVVDELGTEVWRVWLVWLVDDELAGAPEDALLEELPPQPDSSTSVTAIAAPPVIHDLGLARESPTARL